MKFKQNYQDEMDRLSPDDKQLERIRNGVYERLKHEADNTQPAPNHRKKPLRFKIAAISGGACACTCAAVLIIFMNGSVRNSSMALNRTEKDYSGYTLGAANSINQDINCAQNMGGNQMDPTGEYSPPTSIISDSSSETNNASNDGTAFIEMGSVTAPSSSNSLYLMFSEDKSSCTVMMNGKKYVYRETEFGADLSDENYNPFMDESDNPLRSADSNLDIKLFVQFDENVLYVFTESKTLYKCYKGEM